MVSDEIYGVEAMLSHRALASNKRVSFAFSPMFSCIDEQLSSIPTCVSQRHSPLYIRHCFIDKTRPTLPQLNLCLATHDNLKPTHHKQICLAIPCSLKLKYK